MLRRTAEKLKETIEGNQRFIHRWTHIMLPGMVLVAAVAVFNADFDLVRAFQLKVFDQYQRSAPRPYDPGLGVRVIDIDDETLAKLGQWPWPRTLLADFVARFSGQVRVVAFDAIFAEADRTSPRELARSLPASLADVKARLAGLPDSDEVLARAVKAAEREGTSVMMGFSLVHEHGARLPALKRGFNISGPDVSAYLPSFTGAIVNRPLLEAAIAGNGSINSNPDLDGVIRRVSLVFRIGENLYPSLALEALRLAAGADQNYILKSAGGSGERTYGATSGVVAVRIPVEGAPLTIPTDSEGGVWLHFTDPFVPRTIPAWKLFDKGFDPAELGGGIAFIGTSAAGLKDLRATPRNPTAPGVELHAQIAEQVIGGHFLERPDYADQIEKIFFIVLGVLLIALMNRLGAAWCALLTAGSVSLVIWLSWQAFNGAFGGRRLLFDPVLPSFVVLAVYITSTLVGYLRNEAEKRQVRGAFSRYMSPDLVEQLAQDPSRLKLGGEVREMTLMFSDIRGFTTISEQFDAHGLTTFINRYLTPMTQVVLDHGGTIDKYMGDCIMAFWNAPLEVPGHPLNACRAALAMRRDLVALNAGWEAEAKAANRPFIPIHAGIGLNTGPCCVGNMGSDMRFDYSVLGDDVNLASRLEGQSKSYGVDVVIGPNTKAAAPGFAVLELDLIKVKGKTVPVHIYTLLGDEKLAGDPRFQKLAGRHAEMLAAYRGQRWDEASALMSECGKDADALGLGLGKLYHLYEDRIAACRAEPPGPSWDGVFTATSK
ncbi:MAG: adenylate/guanylate cyclase domain-containing protein [Elusimicrobia bacterium]|nr:adenylate/guanylate cyclase domain-containing protein [Elusimicrobiota bacterium]